MIPQQLSEKFTNASPYLLALKRWVADTLAPFADRRKFPFYGRIKTAESLSEKIEMGRYRRFSEIDDLVAFTLIVPGEAFQREVVDFCNASFEVIAVRHKSTTPKPPDVFRFDATRIVARAKRPPDFRGPDEQSIFGYLFEVQVRTAFEHAWSVATHDLVYKSTTIDWRKVRLAAQLKATCETLDATVAAFEPVSTTVIESPWRNIADRANVSQFIAKLIESGTIPSMLAPSSISRCAENVCTLIDALNPKISVTDALGILDEQFARLDTVPVSLSLYQLCFGLLCRGGNVTKVDRILCHVTQELAVLYPETSKVGAIFDYAG